MKVIYSSPLKEARWPWPKMNIEEVAERALGNEIFMPNIGYVDISDVKEWSAELGDAANSKKLWINSLVTPHACLIKSKGNVNDQYFKKSVELVDAYLSQYDSGQGLFDISWKDEHSVSNSLFVLTAFIYCLMDKDDCELSQLSLIYHADRHAQWLSNDNNYVKNNHGVMMDLSLFQFALLIMKLDIKKSERYVNIASSRLNMMFKETFDLQGCCKENSPTYHFVNYSLFLSISSLFHEYGYCEKEDCWSEILDKAKQIGSLFIRNDGTIPLIGDSEAKPGTFFPNTYEQRKSGVGYYPESGIFIFSKPDFQLTMRAGGCRYSHRHIDDLSITLCVDGKDFVVDGGLYNYDIRDELRRRFISTRFHSGLYLESQGNVLFKNSDNPKDMTHFLDF